MKNWISRNYKTLIISAFLIPIITVAIVSISHVTIWYGISNPITWATYLSIGVEIAALSALAAISANMGSKVYFPFGIVTLIQFIGNIYFAYQYIDINSEQFKEWVELVSPLLEYIGVETNDLAGHRRFLSLFGGGMLPIISLSFLHMLVKFTQENTNKVEDSKQVINASDLVGEISRLRLSDNDLNILENALMNPPAPNEKLKNAVKAYKDNVKASAEVVDSQITDAVTLKPKFDNQITDSVTSGKPVVPSLSTEKSKEPFMDELESNIDIEDEKANQEEDWDSYDKLMDLQMNTTTESIPSEDEKSELDLPIETQPVAIEELPENQPIPDTPNPAEVKTVDEELEKKKN